MLTLRVPPGRIFRSQISQSNGTCDHERAAEILHHHGDLLSQRRRPISATPTRRIATDAIARFERLDGKDVFFLTGTDEHGLKMKQTARQGGPHPARAGRPQLGALPRDGRGARPLQRRFHPHHRAAPLPLVGGDLAAHGEAHNGDIFLEEVRRLVLRARRGLLRRERDHASGPTACACGPQGTPVEWTEEETFFFRLSAYQDKLLAHYEKHPDFILPPERRNEVVSFVKGGLRGSLGLAHDARLGHPGAGRAARTSCTCGSTR